MTLVEKVSVVIQLLLAGFLQFAPPVRPELIQKVLGFMVSAIALVFTSAHVPLYLGALPFSTLSIATGLVAFALMPPLLGLLESRFRQHGQRIYSTGVVRETSNRFATHAITNFLGALAAASLVWLARSTNGFDGFLARFTNDAAFNITLPLATIMIFAFVRWQQVDACPDIDERAKRDDAHWERGIAGYSLRHLHQLTNVLYLITVTFTATTAILYLFAYAMEQAKAGKPLTVSWQVILVVVVALSFLYACGSRRSRDHRAVYLTFLTGTPVALGAALVWLSLFRADRARNIAAASVVGIGYGLYCTEAVVSSRGQGEKLHLHYFATTAVAYILVVLLIALNLS